eukprot:UN00638
MLWVIQKKEEKKEGEGGERKKTKQNEGEGGSELWGDVVEHNKKKLLCIVYGGLMSGFKNKKGEERKQNKSNLCDEKSGGGCFDMKRYMFVCMTVCVFWGVVGYQNMVSNNVN